MLEYPVRIFWSMVRHVDRIRSMCELRLLQVMAVGAQGDQSSMNELMASLREQMGTVVKQRERAATSPEEIRKLLADMS